MRAVDHLKLTYNHYELDMFKSVETEKKNR